MIHEEVWQPPRVKSSRLQKQHYLLTLADDSTKLVPRVTSVLDILAKPALMWWAANKERELCVETAVETFGRLGGNISWTEDHFRERLLQRLGDKKAHQKQSQKAKDIGTETHALIQAFLKNQSPPAPSVLEAPQWAFMAWEDWAKSVGFKPIHVETALGSLALNTGGTNDAAGKYEPALAGQGASPPRFLVGEWKSSKRSKTAPDGIYYEAKVQVCVYRAMGIEMGLFPEDAIACVVRLPKDEDDPVLKQKEPVDVVYIEPEEADGYVKDFAAIRQTYERLSMRGVV